MSEATVARMGAVRSLPGVNVMLLGPTGSGKTHCIRTLLDHDDIMDVFVLFTEPGMEVIGDIPCASGLHYHYIPPANTGWAEMIDSAKKINSLSFEALAKLPGINKTKYNQFIEVLETCADFTCDRCGESFGAVDSWGSDRAFVVDSLSGLNVMAMDLVVGSKPTKSQADWGVAMDNLERLIQRLCTSTQCHFVLTAHLEPERDEVSGRVQLMASTLGRKLAPRLPRFFSDVVLCDRQGSKFVWNTAAGNVELKARNLRLSTELEPSFVQILDHWSKRR